MAGVKGRSGRKSTTDEQRRLRVIEKAWAYVEQVLDDPSAAFSVKVDLAKSIIVKNIPQQMEHKGEVTFVSMAEELKSNRFEHSAN